MPVAICLIAGGCRVCWDVKAQWIRLVRQGPGSVVMGESASVRIAGESRAECSPAAAM